MSPAGGYALLGNPAFDLDYLRIDAVASRNSASPEAVLRRQIVREMLNLANGTANGHHALGHEPGKGDLRDCVTAYLRSDPQKSADYRLVFRELGPETSGQPPRRELLGIRPRRGTNSIYVHVCARLRRHPFDQQPGLRRFGERLPGGAGSEADRQTELDTLRAIAHAWKGQQPLSSSRPLAVGVARERRPALSQVAGERRPGWVVGTGWPERG